MSRNGWVAVLALAGLLVTGTLYTFDPLPVDGAAWHGWAIVSSIGLIAVGLVCFVVLLVTGLAALLNWGSDRARSGGRE